MGDYLETTGTISNLMPVWQDKRSLINKKKKEKKKLK